jgi:hypothetical protein
MKKLTILSLIATALVLPTLTVANDWIPQHYARTDWQHKQEQEMNKKEQAFVQAFHDFESGVRLKQSNITELLEVLRKAHDAYGEMNARNMPMKFNFLSMEDCKNQAAKVLATQTAAAPAQS